MAWEEGVVWLICQRTQISCLAQRCVWGKYHIKKFPNRQKNPFQDVFTTKIPVWHTLWWNTNTLLSTCRLQRWPHCWFWSSFPILGKELWETSFKQTGNRRGGWNQQKTKLSISSWYSVFSRLRMKQALIILSHQSSTVVFTTPSTALGVQPWSPALVPAEISPATVLERDAATVMYWLGSISVLIQGSLCPGYPILPPSGSTVVIAWGGFSPQLTAGTAKRTCLCHTEILSFSISCHLPFFL